MPRSTGGAGRPPRGVPVRRAGAASGCGGGARTRGVRRRASSLARVGPLGRRPAPRRPGTPRVARSRIVSATIPIVLRCSSHEVAVDRARRGPGTTTVADVRQAEHDVEGERPLHRVAVVAEPGHAVPRLGLLDQVAGQQHVGVGDPDDEVAGGVAAAGVHQLDQPVAEVEGDRRGEGARPARTTSVACDLGVPRVVAPAAAAARTLSRSPPARCARRRSRGRDRHRAVRRRKHAVAEGVVEVLVGVDRPQHRQARSRRRSATTLAGQRRPRRGCRPTSRPASPATTETLTSQPRVARDPDAVGDLGEPCRSVGSRAPDRP